MEIQIIANIEDLKVANERYGLTELATQFPDVKRFLQGKEKLIKAKQQGVLCEMNQLIRKKANAPNHTDKNWTEYHCFDANTFASELIEEYPKAREMAKKISTEVHPETVVKCMIHALSLTEFGYLWIHPNSSTKCSETVSRWGFYRTDSRDTLRLDQIEAQGDKSLPDFGYFREKILRSGRPQCEIPPYGGGDPEEFLKSALDYGI